MCFFCGALHAKTLALQLTGSVSGVVPDAYILASASGAGVGVSSVPALGD